MPLGMRERKFFCVHIYFPLEVNATEALEIRWFSL